MAQTELKVIVIGGGFGGIKFVQKFTKKMRFSGKKISLTLISDKNYFLFTPLLHEVATGSIAPGNIVLSIRKILHKFCKKHRFVVADVEKVDLKNKKVLTALGAFDYDYLVVSAGSKTRMFGFERDAVLTLKNLEDAKRLKNQMIDAFERAEQVEDPQERKKLLSFVVIGGGPTGVELAAEISEFAASSLAKFYPKIGAGDLAVYLVHADNFLVKSMSPYIRMIALESLQRNKFMHVFLRSRVKSILGDCVELEDGRKIFTATPILTAGIQAIDLPTVPELERSGSGQFLVNDYLQLHDFPEVFVIGDMASIKQNEESLVPQTAQAAEAEAVLVAKNLLAALWGKPLKAFEFREKGQLVSLGRFKAAASLFGITFSGIFAWWIWRTIYLMKMPGFANRLRIVIDWTVDLFYSRDITRL